MTTSLMLSSTPEYLPAPEGIHNARIVTVADIGFQIDSWSTKRKLIVTFELVDEPLENSEKGLNFAVSRTYSATLGKRASLRELVENITGKLVGAGNTDIFEVLLDRPCQVQIVHEDRDGKTYANIRSVTGIAKNAVVAPAKADLIVYNTADPDESVLAKLPQWIRSKILTAVPDPALTKAKKSEGSGSTGGTPTGMGSADPGEVLPF